MNTVLLIITIVIAIVAMLLLRKAVKQFFLMKKLKYATKKPEELINSLKETGKKFFSGNEEIKLDISKDAKGKPILIELKNEQHAEQDIHPKDNKVPTPNIEGKGFPIPIFSTPKEQGLSSKNYNDFNKNRKNNQGQNKPYQKIQIPGSKYKNIKNSGNPGNYGNQQGNKQNSHVTERDRIPSKNQGEFRPKK